ncbi:MAG: caspase family protein, partial [Inquilinus sp.]|nr:caspase family protein [Inquilinus sp.]
MAYRSFDLGRCLRAGAAAVLLVFVASVPEAAAQDNLKRVALVIGNGTYRNAPALTNPANDVRAMAASLRDLGFEVEQGLDLDTAGMVGTIRRFGASAEGADVALVFYAGHGIQVDGVNYLLPVDVSLQRERDLSYEGIPLDLLTSEVGQARRLGVVILDACRDNPFATQLAQALGPTRSSVLGRGLARVENVPADTLIAFATSAGAVAEDGQSANSPYTTALLAHMREPGVEIGQYFRRVRDTVLQATNGRQQPYVYGSLSADAFYLNPPAGGLRVAAVTPAPLPAPRPEGRTEDRGMSSDTERLFWETIKDSTDRGDFDAYLRQFPNGVFTSLARNRIAVLAAGKAAVASPAPTQTAAVAPPAPPLGPADR